MTLSESLERKRFLDENPWVSSWRTAKPRSNTGSGLQVVDYLRMDADDSGQYISGQTAHFLERGELVTAVLCHLRQQGVVFHHNDMVTVNHGGKLTTITVFDYLGARNNSPVGCWAVIYDGKNNFPEGFEVFEAGIRK